MHDASGVLLSFTPFRDMSRLSENVRVVCWPSLPWKEDFQAFTFRLSENVRDWRLLLVGRVGKRRKSDPGPCSLRKHHRWIYAGNLYKYTFFCLFVGFIPTNDAHAEYLPMNICWYFVYTLCCLFLCCPAKYDSRKSDPKICKVQGHQRWMYGGNRDVDKILP